MPTLHFAHLSDIHISQLGNHDELLSGRAAQFLADAVARLNQLDDLDFVLITGDLFDTAGAWEVAQFQQAIAALQKSWVVIPGNHDRQGPAPDAAKGLTRREFAAMFNPQLDERPTDPAAQVGYWSREIAPGVQLIGLDSIKDDDWGGVVDAPQRAWLRAELNQHADKLVLLAVHHPLHKLAPVDDHPYFHRFVCDNGPALLALLDEYPQVKLVFTGHHHLSNVTQFGGRLHVAGPSLCIYPCAYRTLRLTYGDDSPLHLAWETHPASDAATVAEARQAMLDAWLAAGFNKAAIVLHANLAPGREFDRRGAVSL
jgi:3',5'-cyclic AMP phosphodiesterase CpdA